MKGAPPAIPRRNQFILGFIAVVVVAAYFAFVTQAPAAGRRSSGRPIVFAGSGVLFEMDAKGEHLTRLGKVKGDVPNTPVWSPDGDRIAYLSTTTRETELYLIRADGSHNLRLTRNHKIEIAPSWSPSSRRIVVELFGNAAGEDSEILVVRADGQRPRRLTKNDVDDRCPSWAPDGSRIAFSRGAIWTIAPNGHHARRVTSGRDDKAPLWSPNSRRIAFTRVKHPNPRASGQDDLFTVRRNGTRPRRLTATVAEEFYPGWSPDGSRILFLKEERGSDLTELWVMRANGTHKMKLADLGERPEASPSWSRGGNRIVYVAADPDLHSDIWIVRADGSGTPRPLTNTRRRDEYDPSWFSPAMTCA